MITGQSNVEFGLNQAIKMCQKVLIKLVQKLMKQSRPSEIKQSRYNFINQKFANVDGSGLLVVATPWLDFTLAWTILAVKHLAYCVPCC